MLAEFKVTNFRNFKEPVHFKLNNVKNYEFSKRAIKNGNVKTALIYGANGSGKSNLGVALFDLSATITDKEKNNDRRKRLFRNAFNNANTLVEFYYVFNFDDSILKYQYKKDSKEKIIYERMWINDKIVIQYDHIEHQGVVNLSGAETLNTDLNSQDISYVKYVRSNAILDNSAENNIFKKFIDFVDNMLLFSSLENNHYQGFTNGTESLSEGIIKCGKLQEFQDFLSQAGLKYKLIKKEVDGRNEIYCDFNGLELNFYSVASKGTCTLTLFYFWLMQLDKVSLVFIDEFDAFYHNKLADFVVRHVLDKDVQAIITTHNTSIQSNDLLRPDCYYILEDGQIRTFAESTKKDLRKAHNVEKMYRAGSFNV